MNDRVVHRDSYDDVKSSSSEKCELLTKRGFKPSDMFDPQKKAFLTNLSYKLFPVSWVSLLYSNLDLVGASNTCQNDDVPQGTMLGPSLFIFYALMV